MSLLSLVFAAAVACCAAPNEPAYTTLISHRGESLDAPENTLPAFQMAVDRGFGFECDLYLSKDKRIFSFHDSNLKRTTGVNQPCKDALWTETLSKLDAGAWKGPKWKGVRPALLEEILPLARKDRKIYVEIKSGPEIVPYVKEVFAKQTAATPETALFICFDRAVCKALNDLMPEYKTYWLCTARAGKGAARKPRTAASIISVLKKVGAEGVDISFDPAVVTEEFVKEIEAAGFEVHVWTIDKLDMAELAFRRGALTVTTNCAKSLLDQYKAKK
jgi:glycerophosphoryl diester phosphodiesterase